MKMGMLRNFFKFNFIYFLNLLVISSIVHCQSTNDLNPVVLIPGLGGSRLEVKADEAHSCKGQAKMSKYQPLWLNLSYLLPNTFNCFMDRIKVSKSGVHVRAAHFGKTKSVEFLSSYLKFGPGSYMHTLVQQLVRKGLKRDVSIRAAPYDFRLGLDQLDAYFRQMKDLIEETYQINGQKRVMLICHSMGCLRSVHFLNNQSDEWKTKFIHELVTLAAPWAGSVGALFSELIGRDFGLTYLSAKKMREFQRTHPSIIELLPNPKVFKDKVLVSTPSRKFIATQCKKLFEFAECEECSLNHLKIVRPNIQFPRVNTTCIHGVGKPTTSKIEFLADDLDGKFNLIKDDGDGTVNSESLSYCKEWEKMRDHFEFRYLTLSGSDHDDVVKDTRTVGKILEYVL